MLHTSAHHGSDVSWSGGGDRDAHEDGAVASSQGRPSISLQDLPEKMKRVEASLDRIMAATGLRVGDTTGLVSIRETESGTTPSKTSPVDGGSGQEKAVVGINETTSNEGAVVGGGGGDEAKDTPGDDAEGKSKEDAAAVESKGGGGGESFPAEGGGGDAGGVGVDVGVDGGAVGGMNGTVAMIDDFVSGDFPSGVVAAAAAAAAAASKYGGPLNHGVLLANNLRVALDTPESKYGDDITMAMDIRPTTASDLRGGRENKNKAGTRRGADDSLRGGKSRMKRPQRS